MEEMHFESVFDLVTLQNENSLNEKRKRYQEELEVAILSNRELEEIQTLYLLSNGIDIISLPFDVFRIISSYMCPTDSCEVIALRFSCRLFQHAITSIAYLDKYTSHPDIDWMKVDTISMDLNDPFHLFHCNRLQVYTSYENDEAADVLVDVVTHANVHTLTVDSTINTIKYLYTSLATIKRDVQRIILKTPYSFNGILNKLIEKKCNYVSRAIKQVRDEDGEETSMFVYTVVAEGDVLSSLTFPAINWYHHLYNNL